MDIQPIIKETQVFLDHLGLDEEPFGVYYAETKPENAYGPKSGVPISRELEAQGKVDMQALFKTVSCVIGNIWLARKFMKTDELTFTVPLSLYRKMFDALPDSMFNGGKDWTNVRKKVERSAKAWGERE